MSIQDTKEFRVALCGPEDRAEQAELFGQCFKKAISSQGLHWRYDQSPAGMSVSAVSRPFYEEDERLGSGVSGYACSPRRALASGRENSLANVGQTGDVMTHPDWRKRGLFSELDKTVMEETGRRGWPLVFGLPNRRSAHIFLKLGWDQIGTIRPWTLVLKSDARARKGRLRDGRLKSAMTAVAAMSARRARKRLAAQSKGFQAKPLDRFPESVIELSREVEARHSFMVRRDAAYLNWRFCQAPSQAFRCFGVEDGEGRFAGYCVVQPPQDERGVGFLVDVLAPNPAAQACALGAGLAHLEQAGASLVEATAVDDTWWRDTVAGIGFQPPKPDNHLIVILYAHQPDHPLVKAARDVRSWYFTDGDRDDETIG